MWRGLLDLLNSMKTEPFTGSKSLAFNRANSLSRAPVKRPAWTRRRKSWLGQAFTRRTCSVGVRKRTREAWVPRKSLSSFQASLDCTRRSR